MNFLSFKNEFIRHTGLMFIGVGLFNLFNLLYHFFMVRYLPPVEYGHLNTLMALFMVISVPASTVQTTITKFVSSFQAQKKSQQVRELVRHGLILMSAVAFAIFLLITLGSPLISSFLQISSYSLVILLGTILLFATVIPVPWGGLQGLQRFGSLTLNLILNGILKFSLGILFVLLGLGVLGAIGAIALSYFVTTFISLAMLSLCLPPKEILTLREQSPGESDPSFISEMYKYFLPTGVTLLCFMLLTNIDLILVKHFFTDVEAGYYSIAQMVGKIILFLPFPVVMVMFPKLASLMGQEKKALLILKHSLLITLFLGSVAILLGFLLPSLVIRILSGKVHLECIPLVRFFCINMTLFSLIYILLYYHLSTHDRLFLYPLVCLTLLQIVTIVFIHNTLIQVLLVVAIIGLCLLGINLFLAYFPHRKGIAR